MIRSIDLHRPRSATLNKLIFMEPTGRTREDEKRGNIRWYFFGRAYKSFSLKKASRCSGSILKRVAFLKMTDSTEICVNFELWVDAHVLKCTTVRWYERVICAHTAAGQSLFAKDARVYRLGRLRRWFLHKLTDGNAAHAVNIMTTALRYIPQSNFEVRPNPFGSYGGSLDFVGAPYGLEPGALRAASDEIVRNWDNVEIRIKQFWHGFEYGVLQDEDADAFPAHGERGNRNCFHVFGNSAHILERVRVLGFHLTLMGSGVLRQSSEHACFEEHLDLHNANDVAIICVLSRSDTHDESEDAEEYAQEKSGVHIRTLPLSQTCPKVRFSWLCVVMELL
ncbi:hypothetical protein AURANDRAFT_68450 [Aureococcus anophagefferens]|uniref:Uncharacterized protein n=1 Tax=Aureococcus anophagefferens TaxID=44056 RepID=F0YPP2_AURAN|nr:hypothetical protein AURANDRAFT_68450 [Aureococcus anophagefferens]EGB02918.1 hypothetical protein AURANDRAFT_68450 [Aureococcus anophagefferens]|eukprot:XP_009042384.1 hypothetical protein AURANDRAFT_68450 [Aureococcus anophagefferens]